MTANTSADQFQFSEEYVEEAFEEQLDFEDAPVDPQNPGFASLLTALYQARNSAIEVDVLVTYHGALCFRLSEARKHLSEMRVPQEIWEQVAPAVAATNGLLDELEYSLDCLADYQTSGNSNSLEESITRLEGVHDELRAAF